MHFALYYKKSITMLVNSFNLSQSSVITRIISFTQKWFKTEINCFCIRTQEIYNNVGQQF